MAKESKRSLKINYQYRSSSGKMPQIRLGGQWLKSLGFEIGQTIVVEMSNNKIIISHE
ncbi:MAG: SymE family type I addiction module toxin [Runella zeae]